MKCSSAWPRQMNMYVRVILSMLFRKYSQVSSVLQPSLLKLSRAFLLLPSPNILWQRGLRSLRVSYNFIFGLPLAYPCGLLLSLRLGFLQSRPSRIMESSGVAKKHVPSYLCFQLSNESNYRRQLWIIKETSEIIKPISSELAFSYPRRQIT